MTSLAPTLQPRSGFGLLDGLLALLLAAATVVGVAWRSSPGGGLVEIADDEVAVLVDLRSGEEKVLTTPGYVSFLPWLQEVHRFKITPTEYRMEGDSPKGPTLVERLLVRTKDGSSFWFGSFTLQYALRPEEAIRALHEAGGAVPEGSVPFGADAVRAYARSILRDEFGRYSAEEVVRPENQRAATLASQTRLDAALRPLGVEILEIATPKPKFDRRYEETIERRKVANQEVERLAAREEKLSRERERRLSEVRQKTALDQRRLEASLAREATAAEAQSIKKLSLAQSFYEERMAEANAAASKDLERAAALQERFTAEAETLRQHAAALEESGEGAVRAAWIKRLAKIPFRFTPIAEDASPERIEIIGGAKSASLSTKKSGSKVSRVSTGGAQ